MGPHERRRIRGCFVPEERNGHGAVTTMTLAENAFLSGFSRGGLVRFGVIDNKRTHQFADNIIKTFDVRTTGPKAEARSLSGGNLQKFLVGREVMQDPSVLIINQPTWGVDAGAALAIHEAIMALAQAGAAVMIISQDLDEIFVLADRIAVIAGGHISEPVLTREATVELIGRLMGGTASPLRRMPPREKAGSSPFMLKIEPRGFESKFWRYASPILALLLTGATSGLIFAGMGRPAGLTVYTFLVAPLLQQDGLQALVVKAAPLIMMGVGLSLAYRANVWNIGTDGQFTLGAICGGGLALAFPDVPALDALPRHDGARNNWRHGERRPRRMAAHQLQRQRDPDQSDADLRHAIFAGLSGGRALARPAGIWLSADRVVLRQRDRVRV